MTAATCYVSWCQHRAAGDGPDAKACACHGARVNELGPGSPLCPDAETLTVTVRHTQCPDCLVPCCVHAVVPTHDPSVLFDYVYGHPLDGETPIAYATRIITERAAAWLPLLDVTHPEFSVVSSDDCEW